VTAKTYSIQAVALGAITLRLEKRWDVLEHSGTGTHHGVLSDAHELMYAGLPPDHRSLLDLDVARQTGLAGNNHLIAQDAIVGHVGVCHEKGPLPKHCGAPAF